VALRAAAFATQLSHQHSSASLGVTHEIDRSEAQPAVRTRAFLLLLEDRIHPCDTMPAAPGIGAGRAGW